MIIVLAEGLPRLAPPVGVPRVNVSVWVGPGSGRSVPVIFKLVLPDAECQRAGRDATVGHARDRGPAERKRHRHGLGDLARCPFSGGWST